MLTGKERLLIVLGGRNYTTTPDELKEYLSASGVEVTIADVSDAGATGASLMASPTPLAALDELGITAVGYALFLAASSGSARNTLGAGAVGDNIFRAVTGAAAGTAIGAPTSVNRGCPLQGIAVADSTATDVATLVSSFNSLLASLRTSGQIAT